MSGLAISPMEVSLPLGIGGPLSVAELLEKCRACVRRLFGTPVKANVVRDLVAVHARSPFVVLGVEVNADVPGAIIPLLGFVRAVKTWIGIAQVVYAVVVSHAVFVINLIFRPYSVKVQPRETAGRVGHESSHLDVTIASRRHGARNFADPLGVPSVVVIGSYLPTEDAGLVVVVQNAANVVSREIGPSGLGHLAKIAQWPRTGQLIVKET